MRGVFKVGEPKNFAAPGAPREMPLNSFFFKIGQTGTIGLNRFKESESSLLFRYIYPSVVYFVLNNDKSVFIELRTRISL